MAKVLLNPMIRSTRGRCGDWIFKRTAHGTCIARRPRPTNRKPTEGERAARERFLMATAFARAVMADPARRPAYEALSRARRKPVFALAVGDFYHPPEIHAIDLDGYHGRFGDTIRVHATDDVEVVRVTVTIRAADGTVCESGPATREAGAWWLYPATTDLPAQHAATVEVSAADHPGNITTETARYP